MHALVIGGTGMLREATLQLARTCDALTLVARRPQALVGESHRIHPLAIDYRESAALAAGLRQAIAAHGPIDLAVCWIHSTAPDAVGVVLAELARPGQPFRFFHIRGSAAADPTRLPRLPVTDLPAVCRYRQIILGFVLQGNGSRWLTHREISAGVLAAIERDQEEYVVGVVRPWERRP